MKTSYCIKREFLDSLNRLNAAYNEEVVGSSNNKDPKGRGRKQGRYYEMIKGRCKIYKCRAVVVFQLLSFLLHAFAEFVTNILIRLGGLVCPSIHNNENHGDHHNDEQPQEENESVKVHSSTRLDVTDIIKNKISQSHNFQYLCPRTKQMPETAKIESTTNVLNPSMTEQKHDRGQQGDLNQETATSDHNCCVGTICTICLNGLDENHHDHHQSHHHPQTSIVQSKICGHAFHED